VGAPPESRQTVQLIVLADYYQFLLLFSISFSPVVAVHGLAHATSAPGKRQGRKTKPPCFLPLRNLKEQWHNCNIMHISHNRQSQIALPPVAIFGCGNTLLGDDGFGPEVIERLARLGLPPTIRLVDAGTAIRDYLFDYLLAPALRPMLLIVVDADPGHGAEIGLLRRCVPDALPAGKIHDFSLHQFPTVNLLRELAAQTGIEVVLFLVGIDPPAALCAPGLSPLVRAAVDQACAQIAELVAPFATSEATAL